MMTMTSKQPARQPSRIIRLTQNVINRIAAGEVVVRPMNAIKELIENSVDAKSSQIEISVAAGGMDKIIVRDNGEGINKTDLAILCDRHTTSKIHNSDDLKNVQTFGFRGEALASLGIVSRVTVTTQTAADKNISYKMEYLDAKPQRAQPLPIAGFPGTTIMCENLFYNMPMRRKALKCTKNELRLITDLVAKFAIHYAGSVAFTLLNIENSREIVTLIRTKKDLTRQEVISAILGSQVDRNLCEISSQNLDSSENKKIKFVLEKLKLKFLGLLTPMAKITSGISSISVRTMIFINHRLVECQPLVHMLELVYSQLLPQCVGKFNKSASRFDSTIFAYLALEMPPDFLDVNVHPTKCEVFFLHEREILDGISESCKEALLSDSDAHAYLVRNTKVELSDEPVLSPQQRTHFQLATAFKSFTKKEAPKETVRVDHKLRTLDAFYGTPKQFNTSASTMDKSSITKCPELIIPDGEKEKDICLIFTPSSKRRCAKESNAVLTLTPNLQIIELDEQSKRAQKWICEKYGVAEKEEAKMRNVLKTKPLQILIKRIEDEASVVLRENLIECKFVGLALDRNLMLTQKGPNLLVLRLAPILKEMFYQLAVRNLGNHGEIAFDKPFNLKQILKSGLKKESGSSDDVDLLVSRLASQQMFLYDYFSFRIQKHQDDNYYLHSVPMLIDKYLPNMKQVPRMMFRIANNMDMSVEMTAVYMVSQILAEFYSNLIEAFDPREEASYRWSLEHVLLSAIKSIYLPSKKLEKSETKAVLRITSLSSLYKAFERC